MIIVRFGSKMSTVDLKDPKNTERVEVGTVTVE